MPGSIITAYDCNLIIGPDLDIGAEDHLDLHRAHTSAKLIAQTKKLLGRKQRPAESSRLTSGNPSRYCNPGYVSTKPSINCVTTSAP